MLVPALKQSGVDSVPSCPKVAAGLVATESEPSFHAVPVLDIKMCTHLSFSLNSPFTACQDRSQDTASSALITAWPHPHNAFKEIRQ